MKHHQFVILDNSLRGAWFNQGQFGLSTALQASARLKHLRGRIQQELFK